MPDLKYRQEKIQERRKQTPWREFLMEIGSRFNVSMYQTSLGVSEIPENNRSSITSQKVYETEKDTYSDRGIEYSSDTDFFEQILQVRLTCPLPNILRRGEVENSTFAGSVGYSNTVYLSFEVFLCENILYSLNIKDQCNKVLNSVMIGGGSQIIFSSLGVFNSMNVFFSKSITDSNTIWFCSNMLNCSECLFCSNLEYKKYCINNTQLSKEKYFLRKKEILQQKDQFVGRYQSMKEPVNNLGSENVTGILSIKCKDTKNTYFSYRLSNSQNTFFVGTEVGNSNIFDVASAGSPHGDDYYAVFGAGRGTHYYCSYSIEGCSNIFYSMALVDCSYCLGCVGLKNKSFCIFNKQYTKEQRHQKVDEIFSQMEKDGTLGEFFPGSMNPFYFNDTAAYLIDDSFTKEEVEAEGYLWRDEAIKVDIPEEVEVVKTEELDQYEGYEDDKRTINPDILKKVIQDPQGNVYRIVKMEYDFLVKHGLPLPRLHRLERLKMNFKIQ